MVCRVLVLLAITAFALAPIGAPARGAPNGGATVEPAPGVILAPVNRQAGWLSLDAPRPRLITGLQAPAYVADLDFAATGWAALAVQSIFPGRDVIGGDLLALDVRSGATHRLVSRADAAESLGAPVWSADGGWLLFQREDLRQPPIAYAYQANIRYPSRIEAVGADGSARWVAIASRSPRPRSLSRAPACLARLSPWRMDSPGISGPLAWTAANRGSLRN